MVHSWNENFSSPIQHLDTINGVELHIKRDDLIHPIVSGNKLFKLKYHVAAALENDAKELVTFGGAFSNHLAATAAYCKAIDLRSVAYVRGERIEPLNPTLAFCEEHDMSLHFVSREAYREKDSPSFLKDLTQAHARGYVVPEGGGGQDGIRGSMEILNPTTEAFDHIAVAVGTGTTTAGLCLAKKEHQNIIAIPIHRHITITDEVVKDEHLKPMVWTDAHLGGYGKWNQQLIEFIRSFHTKYHIKLDPIYTGKAMMSLLSHIENDELPKGSKVLFIHTGGLQGVAGFEQRFKLKLFPQ